MKEKRLKDLDMAKGIGIILVVAGHSGMASEAVVTWLSSFHMPLFFILSGMLAYYKKEEQHPVFYSIKKKARALLVPYAFFSVIYLLIDLYYIIRGREIQLADAVLQTISFSGLSVLWFLPALFIGEILFLSLRKHTSGPVTAVCCCALCFGCLCLERLCGLYDMPRDSSFFLWLGYLITALLRGGISAAFVGMGYCVMWLREKTDSFGLSRIGYFVAAVVFFLANYGVICRNGRTDFRYLSFQNPVLYFAGAFLGSMAVVCLCRALPPVRLLSYLGSNSLVIMLTHLDCFVMYIAHRFAYFMDRFIPVGKEYMLWLNVALAIFLMEAVIIYVGNRFFPFLLGKSFERKNCEVR